MLGYPYLEGTDHNLPFTLLSTLACKVKCKLINILCGITAAEEIDKCKQ